MDSPAIIRSRSRIRIPKLRLQQLPTRRIETAKILYRRCIVTAQLRVRASLRRTSKYLLSLS